MRRVFTPSAMPQRRRRVPPVLGEERHDEAVYLLDSGVAFAFAYVGELELLAGHYGDRLAYTAAVWSEWDDRARTSHRTGRLGESPEERDSRLKHNGLREAGRKLIADGRELFGDPIELDLAEHADAIADLKRQLLDLTGHDEYTVDANDLRHAGECELVRYGVTLMTKDARQVVVLCANDGGARKLARAQALGQRHMYEVLVEMRSDGAISAERAADLYRRMAQVTELPRADRPDL